MTARRELIEAAIRGNQQSSATAAQVYGGAAARADASRTGIEQAVLGGGKKDDDDDDDGGTSATSLAGAAGVAAGKRSATRENIIDDFASNENLTAEQVAKTYGVDVTTATRLEKRARGKEKK